MRDRCVSEHHRGASRLISSSRMVRSWLPGACPGYQLDRPPWLGPPCRGSTTPDGTHDGSSTSATRSPSTTARILLQNADRRGSYRPVRFPQPAATHCIGHLTVAIDARLDVLGVMVDPGGSLKSCRKDAIGPAIDCPPDAHQLMTSNGGSVFAPPDGEENPKLPDECAPRLSSCIPLSC